MIDTCRSKAAFTRDDERECAQLAPHTITRRGSLAEFLSASPLYGGDLDTERQYDEPRDLSL
ncbi:hypothetical protein [Agrobacterium tumefaciens]|uniref:hypothetical protein n=1 Tax=Agrobacterium tumefaciens TaxID=358 RepID=UPI0009BAA356